MRVPILFGVAAIALSTASAQAEKADRDKKAIVSSIKATAENNSGETAYNLEGDIKITQGTIEITAERANLKMIGDFRVLEFFGGPGKPATFRQKREGLPQYVEAYAERGDYDERSDTIRLFSNVRFNSAGDNVAADYAEYNSSTEKMIVRSRAPGRTDNQGNSTARVVVEIQPRNGANKTAPASK